MLRRVFLSLALGLAASCAVAQTAPSPADVGISKGTPDVFKLKGQDNAWTPFGSVDPSTHIFIPGTNGNIAPNDCVKWGPGLTSAGAACNSVTGGAHPANQLTIYTNHAGLLANVTTPTEAWTVQQQGFYAPGDGGAATYQWNETSLCQIGDSGSPIAADGIACVLPVGQDPGTAGRYLLQLDHGIDVRQIGMVGDGVFDNSSLQVTLMTLINPVNTQGSQSDVWFHAKTGQRYTDFYFSQPFHISRSMHIRCEGIPGGGGDASTRLVFPAGIHGVVFDTAQSAPVNPPIGYSTGGMTSCGVVSKGYHVRFPVVTGSNPTITVGVDKWGGTWDFHVGDGVVIFLFGPTDSAPVLPGGTTVAAVNPGAQTITPSSPVVSTYTGDGSAVFRLPVEKAFTVNTTLGSGTITVTSGPSLLQPGDYIWSDAFPFGTPIINVSGTLGAQTVVTGPWHMDYNSETPATKTETGGKMWILPAGLKMFVQTNLHTNYFSGFAWGLEMECSSWGSVQGGCNGSLAEGNIFYGNMIGRLVLGNNSGASASIMNVYAQQTVADIAEFGSVGSNYFADNANSEEDHTALYGIIGICGTGNNSSFFGGYAPTEGGYCANGIGVSTSPGGEVVFWNPIAGVPVGAPTSFSGEFHNKWFFNNDDTDGTQLCMNFSPDIPLSFGIGNNGCNGGNWGLQFFNQFGMWAFRYAGAGGGLPMELTEGAVGGYAGYQAGDLALMNFAQGFLLGDVETGGSAPGPERLVDGGISVPAAVFHQLGDIHFNQQSVQNTNLAWVNTFVGIQHLEADVVQGTTTSVVLDSCPTPVPPVGTPILDYSHPNIPALLGTMASCLSGTLTFQAAASNNGTSGDEIVFLQWRPAGPVANDAAGTSWTLGNYMTLTPVALASLPTTCTAGTFAVVSDGVASPTYNAAVGSTTGAATDPVFCTSGNVWTYH